MLLQPNQVIISVIIPTYHRNDLLAKCLDCLVPGVQTLPAEQYEIIVADDGTHTTAEDMMREQYSWAQWRAGPKKGPAANRNFGAKAALGKWLAFTDDDCLPEPGWLEAYSSSIVPNVLAYEGKVTSDMAANSPMMEAPINLVGGVFNSCNIMVEKKIFFEMSGFDENFPHPAMEDWDFHGRIQAAGLIVRFADAAVIHHPLRRRYWGSRYARLLESHAYLWYKQGHKSPFSTSVLIHIMFGRLRCLISSPAASDTLSAAASWLAEVWYLAPRVRSWEKKYSSRFSR